MITILKIIILIGTSIIVIGSVYLFFAEVVFGEDNIASDDDVFMDE